MNERQPSKRPREVQDDAIATFQRVRKTGSKWAHGPDDLRPAMCAAIEVVRLAVQRGLVEMGEVFGEASSATHQADRVNMVLRELTRPYEEDMR